MSFRIDESCRDGLKSTSCFPPNLEGMLLKSTASCGLSSTSINRAFSLVFSL